MEPVIVVLDLDKKMRIESNASDFVIRGVIRGGD